MSRQIQPVQTLRQRLKHARDLAFRISDALAFRIRETLAFRIGDALAFRIRVCLQAYRKPLQLTSALAAEALETIHSEPSQTLVKKSRTNHCPSDERTAPPKRFGKTFQLLRSANAAALIEFAVALPLLVVLIVGIFDFGAAFNLKQELNNAVREGARFGAAQPTNDISMNKPPSVDAIRFLVDSYLQTAKINDCGLSAIAEPPQGGGLTWVYNASTGCPAALTLTISRGVAVQETVSGAPAENMLCITVQISYPYQWHFNSVIQLLVPGAGYAGVTQIPSDATAVNMD